MSELTGQQRETLAAHFRLRMNGVWSNDWEDQHRRKGLDPMHCNDSICLRSVEDADALAPVVAQMLADAKAEALRTVRQVESDMADQALLAWRTADARRGLSDHEALIVYSDALTRWSERFRMAFEGEYYRAEVSGQEPT